MFGTGINYAPSLSGTSGATNASVSATDSQRGPSRNVWKDAPVHDFIENPLFGMYFFDDFIMSGNVDASGGAFKGSIGQWTVYADQTTGGISNDGAAEGGVIKIGADGNNEGVTMFASAGSFRTTTTSTLALNGKLWFECRVATSTITATKQDQFIGLADNQLSSGLPAAATLITTTDDTLSTTPNILGFFKKSTANPLDWQFVYQLAAGTAVFPTNLITLNGGALTTGFVKLGFVFDPFAFTQQIVSASTGQTAGQLAKPLIKVYVNGVPAAAFLTSTNVAGTAFPTGFMSPAIATMNQTGSSPGTFNVDWIRVAQVANS